MLERELLQLEQDDLAADVLDRRQRLRDATGAKHLEHPLGLPSRGGHLSEAVDGRADRGENATDSRPCMALRLPRDAKHPLALGPVVHLQERIDVLADGDGCARAVQRLAVDADQVDEPFTLELVDLVTRRGREREHGEVCADREPEPRRVLLGRGSSFEDGEEHLAAHPTLDVARSPRLNQVRCRDPRRLRQGAQGLLAQGRNRMLDPDRPDHPPAGANRHRRARIEILHLFEPALEDLAQRVVVRGHHAVRLEHTAVQLPHTGRVREPAGRGSTAGALRRSPGRRGSRTRAPGALRPRS